MGNQQKTEIAALGEFGLIKHISQSFTNKNASTIKGIGDDAAVLDYSAKKMVVTTDLLLEGIHFDLVYCPLRHLGYKAVAVNISDVYAMNAYPKQITVSLGLSSKHSLEMVTELYEGIHAACEKYGVDLVGGDTTSSLTGLTICITAIGEVDADKIAYRSGAKNNDLICVSGDLGAAYMGLQLLEREKKLFATVKEVEPDFHGNEYLLERQLKPEPRKEIVDFLASIDVVPTSMIDVSDGLSSELLHICHQSNTGCRIYEDKVPIDHLTSSVAEEMGLNPLVAALNGGEDYELLFTISLADYEKFTGKTADVNIFVIGHITEREKGCRMITNADQEIDLVAQGWNAFKDE